MMERVDSLLRRLGKVAGPDRKLDALLGAALNVRPAWAESAKGELFPHPNGHVSVGRSGPGWEAEAYTASIDAAVALVEKVLSGWDHGYERGDMIAFGKVWRNGCHDDTVIRGEAPTPPLAILAALLRALPSPVHPQGS